MVMALVTHRYPPTPNATPFPRANMTIVLDQTIVTRNIAAFRAAYTAR